MFINLYKEGDSIEYKLYASGDKFNSVIETLLNNRGISIPKEYMNLDDSVLIDYNKLNRIDFAIECFDFHFCRRDKIGILVDTDVDGLTSGAIMFKYIKDMDDDYPVSYILHQAPKAHGLTEDVIIDDDIKLLIIPDAGSNDVEACNQVRLKGVDIIILDHHICDVENKYAWVVNNQLSEKYDNKELSGVGVVYKFLQALDDFYMNDIADNYLDLVALGLIGDMMDIRSYETKRLIDKGLSSINNKFFKALISAQEYSMNSIVNIHNIQFYIVPILNAMIRIGTMEEKELVFNAMLENYEEFDYKKRGSKETVKEDIYTRASRLCKNAKARHDKLALKSCEELSEKVNEKDKIIIIDCTDLLDGSLTGVVAMKLATKFNKPCILLKKIKEIDSMYGGSARNVRNIDLHDLKKFVQSLNCFEFARGHTNAFGVSISKDNIQKAINEANKALSDSNFKKVFLVDFVMDEEDIDTRFINEVSKFDKYLGQGIEEVKIIAKIILNKENVQLIGKNKNTISYINGNGIKFVMFSCNDDNEILRWANDCFSSNGLEVEIVGKPGINVYQNIATPQVIIEDFNICREYNIESEDEDVW